MKDTIKFLVFWVGTRCSLRCKNCGNLIPYMDQVSFDCTKILENLAYICRDVKIEKMQIQGGEPFTHRNIARVIDVCAQMDHIGKIEISTNGTILPDEETIGVLTKYADKVTVRFSVYDCVNEKSRQQKIDTLKMSGAKVDSYHFMFDSGEWFDSGDYWQERNENREQVKAIFESCNNRACWTLADDYMACCGKILSLRELKNAGGEEGWLDNVLDITSLRLHSQNFAEELSRFDNRYVNEVPGVCAYCKLQNSRIPAAIQLTDEEIKRVWRDKQNL